jgi:hypothetical protein
MLTPAIRTVTTRRSTASGCRFEEPLRLPIAGFGVPMGARQSQEQLCSGALARSFAIPHPKDILELGILCER